MNKKSLAGIGLVSVLAACSSSTPPDNGTGGSSGTGAKGGSNPTGGSGGGAVTGGTGGTGVTTGGTGGTGVTTGGTGGTGVTTGGTGGTGVTTGGTGPAAGTGGSAVGGSSGGPGTGGMAGTGSGLAGMGAGGAPTAGTGAGGGAGADTTGPVTVQLAQVEQTMDGFGINDTWASAMSDSDADAMFNTTGTGIGLTILRVGMNESGDFMSSNISGDMAKAKSRGVKTFIGSCWSPVGSCKDSTTINDGGHVLSSCYTDWGTKIANFAKTNGLTAMSIANEPDFASCGKNEPCNGNYPTTVYNADELVAFVKVAGPLLKTAGVKTIAPEASEWIHTWSNTSASGSDPGNKPSSDPLKCGFPATMCAAGKGYDYGHALYADKTAWGAFDIMGVHQYDTQVAEPWPADVPDKKPVWQTEMSGVKWWPEQGPSSDIGNGVAVAGWIHDAIVRGQAAAWVWWWWNAYDTNDNEGLRLGKDGATDTKRHWTFGNFSKFIRPGYTRVDITGAAPDGVLLSAYKGPSTDATVVIVAINKGAADATVPITIAGTAPASLVPWVTSASLNLIAGTAVTVTGGSFMAALPSKTVTTFVGK